MQLIGGILGILIWSIFGAILLRAAAKWVVKVDLKFGEAYGTIFAIYVINVVVGFLVGSGLRSMEGSENLIKAAPILLLPLSFLIHAGLIGSNLKMSFKSACLVTLAMIAIVLGIGLVVGGVIFAVTKMN
jgi:hypothetical protein